MCGCGSRLALSAFGRLFVYDEILRGTLLTCNKENSRGGRGNESFSMSGLYLSGAFCKVRLRARADEVGGRALERCKIRNWQLWVVGNDRFSLAWCEAKTNVPLAGIGFRAVGVDVETRMQAAGEIVAEADAFVVAILFIGQGVALQRAE